MSQNLISWEDFKKVDIRVGTILQAEYLQKANKPAIKMSIDFGPVGILKTSAQITQHYHPGDLPGKQILAVVNFPPKQIINFISECLVLGVVGLGSKVDLIIPDKGVENGLRVS
jgi:tRNA-binding protein